MRLHALAFAICLAFQLGISCGLGYDQESPLPPSAQEKLQEKPSPAEPRPTSDAHAGHHTGPQNGAPSTAVHDHAAHAMTTVAGGPFRSANALGSGTALQPATTPMAAWHFTPGNWMMMVHAELKAGFNYQGGRRGVGKLQSQNWAMAMGERAVGPGRLLLRGMFSAEPLTAPHGGFPQLFQTGESYRGRPIIDAQHPHDVVMELAASYSISITENVSVQVYGGPVGEPALGPVAFMHRSSAMENPSSPLGHHWQDSTHVAHGVITGGVTAWRFKLEFSRFRGAEPDEDRLRIDLGALDSSSVRVWFTPGRNWAAQFSYGHVVRPDVFHAGDVDRLTSSVTYNRPLALGNWSTSLVWGRNSELHGISNAYLVESSVSFNRRNHLYTRMELVDKQGLFEDNIFDRLGLVCARTQQSSKGLPRIAASANPGTLVCQPGGPLPTANPDGIVFHGGNVPTPGRVYPSEMFNRWFRVGALTFGGVRDLVVVNALRIGLGADVTFRRQPADLDPIYGRRPSFQVFLRFRPGSVR